MAWLNFALKLLGGTPYLACLDGYRAVDRYSELARYRVQHTTARCGLFKIYIYIHKYIDT